MGKETCHVVLQLEAVGKEHKRWNQAPVCIPARLLLELEQFLKLLFFFLICSMWNKVHFIGYYGFLNENGTQRGSKVGSTQ
jgi:hypothetical protein